MQRSDKTLIVGLVTLISSSNFIFAANPSIATVSVVIPALVQISGLTNITLAPTNFSGPITGNTTACVYTNTITPLGSYYVTATSANPASGTFRAINGAHSIVYSAYWNPASAPAQTVTLISGVKSAQQSGGNGSSLTCNGSPTPTLILALPVPR